MPIVKSDGKQWCMKHSTVIKFCYSVHYSAGHEMSPGIAMESAIIWGNTVIVTV